MYLYISIYLYIYIYIKTKLQADTHTNTKRGGGEHSNISNDNMEKGKKKWGSNNSSGWGQRRGRDQLMGPLHSSRGT